MMLSYADIHLTYTFPAIGVLTLITLPFINRWETSKIVFISAVALVFTAPCYDYNILNGARSYSPGRVSAFVGNVPVEEYVSVVQQIVLTSVWSVLCLRWRLPFLNFNHDKRTYQLIRWVPILLLSVASVIGHGMATPGGQTFYLGNILCWTCPVIVLMWYGAGNYFVKNIRLSSVAIAIPTLYLLWVNRIALEEGVWHLNNATSLNVTVARGLPLEEALFTFITTAMVVLAGTCYDKAYGMIVTFSLIYPHQFSISWKFITQMFKAFATSEYSMPSIVTEDLKKCIKVLDNSNIFGTSNYLFHIGIRLDLIIVYALGRITDNVVDDTSASNAEKLKQQLKLYYKFVREQFADRKSDYDVKSKPHEVDVDWTQYESVLPDVELASFRALARIAFFLPRKPFEEVLAGFELDMGGTLYRDENDLLRFCNNVAGSFGALCVYIIMYRYNIEKYEFLEKDDFLIRKSYQIGNGLQFVNIARDLINDSEKLGRCYFPTKYMDDEVEEVRILCKEKNPRSLGNKKLLRYANAMLKIANKHQFEAVDGIKCLPREIRGLILTSIDIYRGLIYSIQSSPSFPNKAKLSKLDKCMIILKGLYIKSLQYVI